MIRFILTFGLGILTLTPHVTRGASGPVKEESDLQKIVYLSDKGPILIDLHLRLDGKSYRSAWSGFMTNLFDYLDRDKDGTLSVAEAKAAPPTAAIASQAAFFGPGGRPAVKMDADGDGKVTRKELAEYYRKTGLPPFQLSFTERDSGIIRLDVYGQMGQSNSPDEMNKRIFALLDRDGDGKLSKAELQGAEKILRRLDKNEDELISSEELKGNPVPTIEDGTTNMAVIDLAVPPGNAQRTFLTLEDSDAAKTVATTVLARYGVQNEKEIDARRLGLTNDEIKALDKNGNGRLDATELSRLGTLAAHLTVTARLGKKGPTEPIIQIQQADKERIKARAVSDKKVIALELDNVQLELRGPQTNGGMSFSIDIKGQYTAQFQMADTDNNGYLDRMEAKKSPLLGGLFDAMDRDGDGQLFEKEMLDYLAKMDTLRNAAVASCLTWTIRDVGEGLFEMIDTDNDRMLSIRELRAMPTLLEKLDRDADKKLARTEIPRRYSATFEPGSSAGGGGFRSVVVFAGGGMRSPARPERKEGPLWFRKMDRNRDGDVSRREWLGSEETFAKIDTDGDGLISPQEATKYDQTMRK